MGLETLNLVEGSPFIASPSRLVCAPTIAGANPRDWTYTVYSQFDGFKLYAEVMQTSTSFQNRNLSIPLSELGDEEELVVRIPSETLTFTATLDEPTTSRKIVVHFHLLNRR
jgi:hypothetical protein